MEKIYKIIREHRESKGISQIYISKQTGISNKKISAVETGRASLRLEEFLLICDKGFNIDPSILIKKTFQDK